jgi:hypothetical protein
MYVCDFYQTLSVKGDYKNNSSVYITYMEEDMVLPKILFSLVFLYEL